MLEIEPLQPFGAIVRGWQAHQDLVAGEKSEILDALRKHLVIVFRAQRQMTDLELIRFAEEFGELIRGKSFFVAGTKLDERILPVSNITEDGGLDLGAGGTRELPWHFDYIFTPRPAKESFLNAVELPKHPPRTSFIDQYKALERLPASLANRIRPLRAHYSLKGGYDGPDPENIPESVHPLVLRHPDTGRETLYVSPTMTRSIVGLPDDESQALVSELCQHLSLEENIYHHVWEMNDLVMFDALGTQHRRDSFDPAERRYMRQLSTLCPAQA